MKTVKPRHIREAGYCIPGAKVWLTRMGLSIADLRHGKITTDYLKQTNDSLAMHVAECAERDNSDE